MIPGVCPDCGFAADLGAFVMAADWNRALAAALEMPAPLAGRVLSYLRLFSPPSKRLAVKKAARLIAELAAAVKAAEVERHGEARRAPLVIWEQALDELLATPPDRLPLENHSYLFAIVHRLAGAATGRQAQRVEDQRHQAGTPRRGEMQPVARVVDREACKAGAARLRDALAARSPTSSKPLGRETQGT